MKLFKLSFAPKLLFLVIRRLLSVDPFSARHETTLEYVKDGVGVFNFLLFLILRTFRSYFRVGHKYLLALLFLYTYFLFNPFQRPVTQGAQNTVLCPDGLAYRLPSGHYIRCEDFDEFHAELYKTNNSRTDLYINANPYKKENPHE